jgi:secreted PhoX family phosphatase
VEGYGQVCRYIPSASGGVLELIYESPGRKALDSPYYLTVTPRGGILICEDDASDNDMDTHPLAPGLDNVNRLIGLGLDSASFEFAINIENDSEFAGATYSRDGSTVRQRVRRSSSDGSAGPHVCHHRTMALRTSIGEEFAERKVDDILLPGAPPISTFDGIRLTGKNERCGRGIINERIHTSG